jgi:predicted nucleic acid-binding protein
MKLPQRLYKYRAFSGRSLSNLVEDQLYFADPSTFNDPLDTKPSLENDLGPDQLESMLFKFVTQRVQGEMESAARTIKYKGPKTRDHIVRHSRRLAEQTISEIRYNATNPELEIEDPLSFLLSQSIERELLRRYDGGIVSLAERNNCPLMWSHYGDQHKGIAVGYSVPDRSAEQLFKVKYGGKSMVEASRVAAMLDGDEEARRAVDDAVLLRKAQDWRYEKEWRLIGRRGAQDSSVELEEIVFGMRCPLAVIYSVVRALENRERPVRFYEIRRKSDTFLLNRYSLDIDELAASLPRRALSIAEALDDLD